MPQFDIPVINKNLNTGRVKIKAPSLRQAVEAIQSKGFCIDVESLTTELGTLHDDVLATIQGKPIESSTEVPNEKGETLSRADKDMVNRVVDTVMQSPKASDNAETWNKSHPYYLLTDAVINDIDGAYVLANDYSEANDNIYYHATSEWPDDYSMQEHVTESQRSDLSLLKHSEAIYTAELVPLRIFKVIRIHAAIEWQTDYCMRHHTEIQQIESFVTIKTIWNDEELSDMRKKILLQAQQEWPNDFVMQYHVYCEQAQAALNMGHPI